MPRVFWGGRLNFGRLSCRWFLKLIDYAAVKASSEETDHNPNEQAQTHIDTRDYMERPPPKGRNRTGEGCSIILAFLHPRSQRTHGNAPQSPWHARFRRYGQEVARPGQAVILLHSRGALSAGPREPLPVLIFTEIFLPRFLALTG